ncbi:pyridoxamine 5'-phosphate oxidase [Pseudoxanthomonas sp. CAU 1598]|uniref:Pyridoxamine 5'-phosphate oxidase n=2 Tax=Pseudomarimonas arenosa TaxID=2774145 RepID=A0AAW3ZJ85_9GAMM|nr:pyridoxamine 5'-phosphate oxidase [Pseudomarimonas arenosa]MBD8525589.1 pyridoxamine 5'-phosphate oxidase [Pseudomarimonas arenosa]
MLAFRDLLEEAKSGPDPEPTTMYLATQGDQGRLGCRAVLLKAHDERGFVFYTNTDSRKGDDLRIHRQCALLFHWRHLRNGVQVRIEGRAEPVSEDEADRYFASRPRMSQIGAWASDQSRTLDSRDVFDTRVAEVEARFEDQPVTRPPHWSGYRVVPDCIELWFGADYRLHERFLYERGEGGVWRKRMLFP